MRLPELRCHGRVGHDKDMRVYRLHDEDGLSFAEAALWARVWVRILQGRGIPARRWGDFGVLCWTPPDDVIAKLRALTEGM